MKTVLYLILSLTLIKEINVSETRDDVKSNKNEDDLKEIKERESILDLDDLSMDVNGLKKLEQSLNTTLDLDRTFNIDKSNGKYFNGRAPGTNGKG
jgi:hypothetical protein